MAVAYIGCRENCGLSNVVVAVDVAAAAAETAETAEVVVEVADGAEAQRHDVEIDHTWTLNGSYPRGTTSMDGTRLDSADNGATAVGNSCPRYDLLRSCARLIEHGSYSRDTLKLKWIVETRARYLAPDARGPKRVAVNEAGR